MLLNKHFGQFRSQLSVKDGIIIKISYKKD